MDRRHSLVISNSQNHNRCAEKIFVSFGLPKEQLVTMHIIGFKILIPPYYMASNSTAKRAIQVRSEADYAEDGKPVTTSTTTSKIPTDILYNTS